MWSLHSFLLHSCIHKYIHKSVYHILFLYMLAWSVCLIACFHKVTQQFPNDINLINSNSEDGHLDIFKSIIGSFSQMKRTSPGFRHTFAAYYGYTVCLLNVLGWQEDAGILQHSCQWHAVVFQQPWMYEWRSRLASTEGDVKIMCGMCAEPRLATVFIIQVFFWKICGITVRESFLCEKFVLIFLLFTLALHSVVPLGGFTNS